MCGICGFVSASGTLDDRRPVLERMTATLRHRGPDDEGYYLNGEIALGMRRLSIIDLDTGEQPVENEDGSIKAIFNGEIYNFRALRSSLISKGHRFRSKGDTEVIVHAYEEYGDDFLTKLNGMFAIALWDTSRKRLLLARDRLGIKPLYYWTNGDELVFGSELKAVMSHPNPPRDLDIVSVDQFLTLEYVPSPRSIFADVSKLKPGHILSFEKGQIESVAYWRLERMELPNDVQSLEEELDRLIRDSVNLRMISDVPIGAFLSGGIDSSTVLAYMSELSDQPITAFSIGFEDASYDELPYARLVARRYGARHIERVVGSDMYSLTEQLTAQFDEPFGDFSIFPTYLVSRVASEHVKVVLSGDGGDEIFGGYDTYLAHSLDRYYRLLPESLRASVFPSIVSQIRPSSKKKGLINKAKRFVEGGALPPALQHSRWMMFMSRDDKRSLYRDGVLSTIDGNSAEELLTGWFSHVEQLKDLDQQQFVDIHTYLPDDILTKVDRMSMAASLEARVPLLDYRLVEFAWNLPGELKLHRTQSKVLLRRAMKRMLPAAVIDKSKEGFSVPIKHWLRGPLRPLMEDLLSPSAIRSTDLFREDCVQRWISEHLEGRANHSHRLWSLMVFQLWRHRVGRSAAV